MGPQRTAGGALLRRHQPLHPSAFAAVCALNPNRDEIEIARKIRAASPIASPNRRIVSLADRALGRNGRMLRALDEMGPGSMMVEGRPFVIELE